MGYTVEKPGDADRQREDAQQRVLGGSSPNNITDEGAMAIVEALRHNTTLGLLNLTDNPITAAEVKAFEDLLAVNRTIDTLGSVCLTCLLAVSVLPCQKKTRTLGQVLSKYFSCIFWHGPWVAHWCSKKENALQWSALKQSHAAEIELPGWQQFAE